MRKILVAIMMVVALTAAAELREDAFTIRTTDGAAAGYLFEDVEKITFSNIGYDGIPHTGIYYQELHFPDTIIRMPVTEIEAVTFEKPSVKYQKDVVMGSETGLLKYLEWGYDSALMFKPSTPMDILPKEGQILTFLEDNYVIGIFAGRVVSVEDIGSYIRVNTEQLESIRDIYEELVGVEALTSDSPGVEECLRKAKALPKDNGKSRAIGGGGKTLDFDVPIYFSKSFGDDDDDEPWMGGEQGWSTGSGIKFSGGIEGSISLRLSYEVTSKTEFLGIRAEYEYTPSLSVSVEAEASWLKTFWEPTDYPVLNVAIPSAPVFTVKFGVAPFVKLSGSASVSFWKTFPTSRSRMYAQYENGRYYSKSLNANELPANKGVENEGDYGITISLEGSFGFGLDMGLSIGTTRLFKSSIGIIAEAYVGPKLSGSIGITPTRQEGEHLNTVAYNSLKDWSVSATWCNVELSLSYYKEVVGRFSKTSFGGVSLDFDSHTFSLLPEFDAPEWELPDYVYNEDAYGAWSIATPVNINVPSPSGTCLMPIMPGYAIFDEDGNFIQDNYSTHCYYFATEDDPDFEDMQWEFKRWVTNKKYKVYPAFKMFNAKQWELFRAEPARELLVEGKVETGSTRFFSQGARYHYVEISGHVDTGFMMCPMGYGSGFIIDDSASAIEDIMASDNPLVSSVRPRTPDGNFTLTFDLDYLTPNKTYYYCAYAYAQGKYYYGEINHFTTPAED